MGSVAGGLTSVFGMEWVVPLRHYRQKSFIRFLAPTPSPYRRPTKGLLRVGSVAGGLNFRSSECVRVVPSAITARKGYILFVILCGQSLVLSRWSLVLARNIA